MVFLGAIVCLVVSARRHPGVEDVSRPKGEGGHEMAGGPRRGVAVKAGGATREDT